MATHEERVRAEKVVRNCERDIKKLLFGIQTHEKRSADLQGYVEKLKIKQEKAFRILHAEYRLFPY